MNILPKKRWHVRTKDNIARVRRDEAKAAEEERVKQEKLLFAESEARINFLRNKQGISKEESESQPSRVQEIASTSNHVDLFSDFKQFQKKGNEEHAKEQKQEKEKYEKQMGYLTYLGQDTNEALKLKSWYEKAPVRGETDEYQHKSSIIENDSKTKFLNDPLTLIHAVLPPEKYLVPEKKRSKTPEKHKKSKKEKKERKQKKKKSKRKYEKDRIDEKKAKLEKLRKERLKREAREKARQDKLLSKDIPAQPKEQPNPNVPQYNQKYNSQFNPHIAKQNIN